MQDADIILLEDADAKPMLGDCACAKPPDGANSMQANCAAAQDADAEPTLGDGAGPGAKPPNGHRVPDRLKRTAQRLAVPAHWPLQLFLPPRRMFLLLLDHLAPETY